MSRFLMREDTRVLGENPRSEIEDRCMWIETQSTYNDRRGGRAD